VTDLLILSHYGTHPVAGVALAWEGTGGGLLWSSVSRGDSAALWQLAARTLLPATRAGRGGGRGAYRRPVAGGGAPGAGAGGASFWAGQPLTLVDCWQVVSDLPGCQAAASSSGNGSSGGSGVVLPVPACLGGGPAAGGGGGGAAPLLPRVWLGGGDEAALLLPWHCGPLLVMLLLHDSGRGPGAPQPSGPPGVLPVSSAATSSAAAGAGGGGGDGRSLAGSSGGGSLAPGAVGALLGALVPRGAALAAQLAAELGAAGELSHVRGCRYHYLDGVLGMAR
jgi:hypothetical protein